MLLSAQGARLAGAQGAMLGGDQDALLRWFLDVLDGVGSEPPDLDADRFAAAGLASGLTAAVAAVTADHPAGHPAQLPVAWRPFAEEQRDEVARRQARFAIVTGEVLAALATAGVGAVPVKGAVLAGEVWPRPDARPMADIDLVVAPADRGRARGALEGAGFRLAGTAPWEDTYLAWGDGSAGRLDGESAEHNGKVEIHPGWMERFHNYLVGDAGMLLDHARPSTLAGAPCRRVSPALLALHALGHLSACVARAEVRALNVVDLVLLLRRLDAGDRVEFAASAARLDPRLVAPGCWLVTAYRPDATAWVVRPRLRRPAQRLLEATPPEAVLRDPNARTDLRWRLTWVHGRGEATAVVRQLLWPGPGEREPAAGPVWQFQLGRARRGLSRVARRPAQRCRRAA